MDWTMSRDKMNRETLPAPEIQHISGYQISKCVYQCYHPLQESVGKSQQYMGIHLRSNFWSVLSFLECNMECVVWSSMLTNTSFLEEKNWPKNWP